MLLARRSQGYWRDFPDIENGRNLHHAHSDNGMQALEYNWHVLYACIKELPYRPEFDVFPVSS